MNAIDLEGTRAGFVPSICKLDLADKVTLVKDEDAYKTVRKLAENGRNHWGNTIGANVLAAGICSNCYILKL